MATAYVVGTFDTKGAELGYVADLIRAAGVAVTTVDLSTAGTADAGTADGSSADGSSADGGPDVSAREVAAAHPDGPDAVFTGDRGSAVGAMAVAFEAYLTGRSDLRAGGGGGVIGMGGSGGTALVTPALRALPVGVPKLMVSTLAGGDVSRYVGASDIVMLPSITDVAGLNRISRTVLGNAAHALAGMLANTVPPATDKKAVALSMFGVTTPCVTAVAGQLEAEYDCLVFHATGTGGAAMEKLADDGLVAAMVDVSTTEIADEVAGGFFTAGPGRLDAVARTRIPYVGSCGALDMVNFFGMDSVPERYRDRQLHVHNPQITLMRTDVEENRKIGEFIAAKLNACAGPVRFLIPEGGVSMLDAEGQAFWNPEADRVLFDTIEQGVEQTADRQVRRLPYNVNDSEFADALVAALREVTG